MNCLEAKKIPILNYLQTKNIRPKNHKNESFWFNSPFRNETKPSFKVDQKNNIWYDFGTGTGGNILDLVMQIEQTDIPGALKILKSPEISNTSFFSFAQHSLENSALELKHFQSLQNRALIQYLESRKITHAKAVHYVKEVYFKANGKQYFAIAFENDSGGYELRNKYFQGSTSPKAPTTIKSNPEKLNIFEGFFDFLSALEYSKSLRLKYDTIILNSVINLNMISNVFNSYNQINLFLDNDRAGEQAAETIKKNHTNVKNFSKIIYPDHKDFNDFLVEKM